MQRSTRTMPAEETPRLTDDECAEVSRRNGRLFKGPISEAVRIKLRTQAVAAEWVVRDEATPKRILRYCAEPQSPFLASLKDLERTLKQDRGQSQGWRVRLEELQRLTGLMPRRPGESSGGSRLGSIAKRSSSRSRVS
jgi:hypothetical protein